MVPINIFWDDDMARDISMNGLHGVYKPCRIAGMGLDAYFSFRGQECGFLAIFEQTEKIESNRFMNGHYFASSLVQEVKRASGVSCVWRHEDGSVLAWYGSDDVERCECEHIVNVPYERLIYSWDALNLHESTMPRLKYGACQGDVSDKASLFGEVTVEEGTIILPGVVIEGYVKIGKNCKIGPNCYLRGCVAIGDGCIVGQGVEVKNSILGQETFISHLSYVGDSILGDHVNVGGGTIISNYRHDEQEHRMRNVQGELLPTGRLKLGAVLENGVKCGANSVVLPGRRMKTQTWSLPGEIVR